MKESTSILLHLLRALSVQMVVIGHGIVFFRIFILLQPPYFAFIQNIGVVILFILSGIVISFSICRNVDNNKNYCFRDYFINRFSRIYAGFIPALFFVAVIDLISISIDGTNYKHYDAFNLITFVGNLLMLQDYPIIQFLSKFNPSINITSFGSGRPFWALAVEWWIYLLFGWVVLKDGQCRTKIFYIILFLFSIVPLFNLVNGRGHGLTLVWLMGVVIYYVYRNSKRINNLAHCLPLAILFLILSILYLSVRKEAYDLIFETLLSISIFFLVIYTNSAAIIANGSFKKVIIYVSSYSYTLFLTHYSIFELFVNYEESYSHYLLFIIAFIMSNLVSSCLAHFFERNYKYLSNLLKAYFL